MNYKIVHVALIALAFIFGYTLNGFISGNSIISNSDKNSETNASSIRDEEVDTDMSMNDPEPVEINKENPYPQVSIVESFQGKMGEYNVQISLDNFTFTPGNIDDNPIANEGHGHVYVNDEKAGRVYGEWVHIPAHYFDKGRNKITIALNANNHGPWTINDSVIEDTIFVQYE